MPPYTNRLHMICRYFLSLLFGFIFFTIVSAQTAILPPGFAQLLLAEELDPTTMALTPDGRLFITEKNGRILIVENGILLTDPFLTLEVDNYNERGLSGIAIDPHFEDNGYIYVYYTVKNEDHNRISRFTADGNYVVPGSELILLDINQLNGTIHNAGSMAFGLDEKLYISVGDGANAPTAQSFNSLLGKVLRINSDGTIPADNPYYNTATGNYRAIYALGFRNSFSMAVQPGTGKIFATEVGNSTWEEVNDILPGTNYGWPIIEGPINGQTPPANYKEPVFAYRHDDGCAAVGATFYNPATNLFPAIYAGKFFFADYCDGYIKFMDPNVPGIAATFATEINRPLNLLTAPDGTMYYLARAGLGGGSEQDNTASNDGTLWRIFYSGSNAPFVSVNPQSVLISVGEDAHFFTAASGQQPLFYQWQKDGIDFPGADSADLIFQNAQLIDSGTLFRCIITNLNGADTTLSAVLHVTSNQRPTPEIITPVEGTTYRAGDVLQFSGHAIDPEQGLLSATSLKWKIDFHHNIHTHPGLIPTSGITEGEFTIPTTGETSSDVWYRIYLTATDTAGLSSTVFRDVFPVKSTFQINTIPQGLPVYVEGDYLVSPFTVTSVVGLTRTIEAVPSAVSGDSIYLFKNWLDGDTSFTRTFSVTDAPQIFTAVYESYPVGKGIGLQGHYYDSPDFDPTFYEPAAFTRIDSVVDFDWGQGSPSASLLGDDHWLVRWDGYIEPLFSGTYTFYVTSDDGARLWIGSEEIVDKWIPQPATEWSGTIDLAAGQQYPVYLEFYEEGGGAVCQFSWSSDRIGKSIVPRSQLFPESATSVDPVDQRTSLIALYPNPARDIFYLEVLQTNISIRSFEIQNALGRVVFQNSNPLSSDKIRIDMKEFPQGMYWLQYELNTGERGVMPLLKM